MPRKLRVEYPGAIYHVMSRGDRREDVFLDDVDRQDFLKTLAEACQKSGWQVHAYCLMNNHFHLASFKTVQGTGTSRLHDMTKPISVAAGPRPCPLRSRSGGSIDDVGALVLEDDSADC